MSLPFFYTDPIPPSNNIIVLNEENSKHIVQVLRMQNGKQIKLTDGFGNIYLAEIIDAHKKNCNVKIIEKTMQEPQVNKICVAISPVKNNSRLEWFLEKATEIGVTEVVLLICERTEKQNIRLDRMKGILISAMLQSQQAWLPILEEPKKFTEFTKSVQSSSKFIAHCEEDKKVSLKETLAIKSFNDTTILIGPEGDFSPKEIALALENNFEPVALGNTRLRTETAALVAATLLCVQ
ncbi:MAG: 16S rRNA (uracil(1498)-N(3))-methyltransferase [Ferruginibacter sp.]|nr:16S rRNA (uracil(1498)-N(3))-methyltransferase [Ferruginibacter sp.]